MGSEYVKVPEPSEDERALYEAVLKVMAGSMTVIDAAKSVGLSRVHFQSRMHRGLSGLLESLGPQKRGRKAVPEAERALTRQVTSLEKENEELRRQLEASARMMGVASEWMRKGLAAAPRGRKTKPTAEAAMSESDDDGPARLLEMIAALETQGVASALACAAAGTASSTARRWRQRRRAGESMRSKRGPRPENVVCADAKENAEKVLNSTKAQLGAAALARQTGLSRRTAAVVKAEHLTRSERERRARTERVSVAPGVIRGFDAMDVSGVPVLLSSDGGVPYRTSVFVAERYDTAAVAEAVARDFAMHGAPLVWRVDRWKAHVTQPVLDVLREYEVLLMHGPPRCPRFYGQTERQNREHRGWFEALGPCDMERLPDECESMLWAFNELKPRRTLGWRTAGEAWRSRQVVTVDRRELAEEVAERAEKLKQEAHRVAYPGLVERLAIQAALTQRGLLKVTKGGWC
jgi:hypothetical protein